MPSEPARFLDLWKPGEAEAGPVAWLRELAERPEHRGAIAHWHVVPPRTARHGTLAWPLPGPLLEALRLDRAMLAPCAVFVGSSYARFDAQPGPGIPAHLVVSLAAVLAAAGVNLVDEAWDLWGAPASDGLDAKEAAVMGAVCLMLALLVAAALVPLSGGAAADRGDELVFFRGPTEAWTVRFSRFWGPARISSIAPAGRAVE